MIIKFRRDEPPPPWRVGVFASSADPGMQVLMGFIGRQRIVEFGAHPDFIRWLSPDPLASAGDRIAFYKTAIADPRNHAALAQELAALSANQDGSASSSASGAEAEPTISALGTSVPAYRTHKTEPGESLCGIAIRQLGDETRWVEIRDLNAGRFPDMLGTDYYPVGTVLRLPSPKELASDAADKQHR